MGLQGLWALIGRIGFGVQDEGFRVRVWDFRVWVSGLEGLGFGVEAWSYGLGDIGLLLRGRSGFISELLLGGKG